MRPLPLAAVAVLLALSAATAAHAQPSLFSRVFVSLDGPLLCEDVGTLAAACSAGVTNPFASLGGEARAEASFGTLRGYAFMRQSIFGGTLVTEDSRASSVARSTDQMTFSSSDVTTGEYYTSFDLTGNIIGPFARAALRVNGGNGAPVGPTSLLFGPFPFVVGVPLDLEIELEVEASAFNFTDATSIADFENTARLLGVRFTDESGAPLPGITIATASGAVVPNLTVTAAPEPATLSLSGAGAAALAVALRRRRGPRASGAARPAPRSAGGC
jgi:hypothetical protein